jgi:uncharacterized protein (TIGR03435 family)
MRTWIACVFLLSCRAGFPQQPAFEVASIKPAKPLPMGQRRIGMNSDGGMLRYTNVSLRDCIRVAYRVKEFQVQGPDSLSERFDIVAKLPDGSSEEQIPEMLQALLSERFKLKLHSDTKEHSIYALVVAKGGPKLKPAEIPTADGAAAGGRRPSAGGPRRGMSIMMGPDGAHLKAPSAALSTLAEMISRFSERPVVDMTGVEGQYDFDLVFTPENTPNMPGMMRRPMGPPPGGGPAPGEPPAPRAGSIYDSVRPYGLKLEPRKAPMQILIVDHIEKTPTEN